MKPERLRELRDQYRNALLDDVVPFWLKHSPDYEKGGYFTCLDRDGSVYDTDKMMWMQWRAVWTFSVLYQEVEARPEWLEAARVGYAFLVRHGRTADGDWYFLLNREGVPQVAAYNVFSDYFAVLGLARYSVASGDDAARALAFATLDRIGQRLPNPKGVFQKRLPGSPPIEDHARWMIHLSVAEELVRLFGETSLEDEIDACLSRLSEGFVDWDAGILYENALRGGGRPRGPAGRLLNPGHAAESCWFMLETARRRGDLSRAPEVTALLLAMLERGWDVDHGGLFAFLDAEGRPPEPLEWSMKLWWPHTEALYALLLAWSVTGNPACADWFERVHAYTWTHFPDPEYGEWFGYLDRQGNPTHRLKGSKWKGFYHVPRCLFLCSGLLDDMCSG